ncbi:MAG: sulfite exporter TauE/SafE family protein [Gammaproteobacteria bacterium]|nr:sulfite exporter TauE/SafE family protein [Gammaproteobacteria bacterium]
MDLLFLLSMGAIAGMLAGLLGIGGGIVIVPVLAIVFATQGVDPAVLMHVAVGTSLGTIVVTSLSSMRAHQKRGAIVWGTFRQITPGIIIGTLFGAWVAKQIPGEDLKLMFALFMLLVASQMAMGMASKPHTQLPGRVGMSVTGVLIGIVSAIMGIGGGSMSVPFLTYCNMAVKNAVATSAAIGLPIAVSGALGFVISGWDVALRPEMSLGYINLPAFLGIVVASTLFAPLGARLAHSLPDLVLKRFFAVFLAVLGLKLLLG